jgi:hypothetical protein
MLYWVHSSLREEDPDVDIPLWRRRWVFNREASETGSREPRGETVSKSIKINGIGDEGRDMDGDTNGKWKETRYLRP